MKDSYTETIKRRVARETAVLLYTLQEKEYKQAKIKAAQALSARVLPSNREVAEELDRLADEIEGESRQSNLIHLRENAFQIMQVLQEFNPLLVGSVWRGTANRNSDIDIITFHADPEKVMETLRKHKFKIVNTEWRSTTKRGEKKKSFHIYVSLPSGKQAEIVVRNVEEQNTRERCEIYGDLITGLNLSQLQTVLQKNPLKKFLPL